MTVTNNYNTITYIANGVTTNFPWTYDYDATYGALVVKNETDDITYVEGEDYTITNKTVIFNTAPADGKTIVLSRFTYRGQEVTFIEGEDFPAKDYETSLDRLFMIEQEQDKGLADETAARIAADIVLQANIDAEAATRAAADITLQGNIDAEEEARIAADNEIRSLINATENQAIYARAATYAGGDIAQIDVSDVVEDGVAYVPIVTTAVTSANKEARKTLNSICWYYKSQKKIQLLFTDNTYQSTNNIQYGVTLIPTNQSYTGDGIKGITDGLDNLGGSGGGSGGISIRSLVFEDVAASEPTGAVVLETSVSDYVADGQDYMPIYIAWSGIEQIDREIIYNPTQKCVSVIAYHTNGTSHDIRGDLFLIPVERKDTYSTLPSGYTNGLYVHRVTGFLETTDNLVTSVSSTSTDNEYPSAKCVYDALQNINVINSATGYDATKTQILKNVNGVLTWVDEV